MTITDATALTAAEAIHVYDKHDPWDDEACNDTGDGVHPSCKEWTIGMARAALEAAYPAIRQQVAEQIAVALDAVPAEVYPEDIFPPDGTSIDCQSARVMRFAYPAAASIAREIGGGA